ncbi:unnamed protein product, partial [Rotaria sp. Silwood2]
MDIVFVNSNSVFTRDVYHRLYFETNPSSLLPDVIERPVQDKLKWLREAYRRPAQYCSNHILWRLQFIDQVHVQFTDDFGLMTRRQYQSPNAANFVPGQVRRYDQLHSILKNRPKHHQQAMFESHNISNSTTSTIVDCEKEYYKKCFDKGFDPNPRLADV